jgi:hypothetical protein
MAADIDLMSTYVGGSQACIDALLTAPHLEATEAEVTHGITYCLRFRLLSPFGVAIPTRARTAHWPVLP